MLPLLLGQAPSRSSVRPFDGMSGRRIAALAGIERERLEERAELANLVDAFPGKAKGKGKGDAFSVAAGRTAALALRPKLAGRLVIVVGRHVATALGGAVRDAEELAIGLDDGFAFARLPHPSGVNLWWNDRGNAARAGKLLRGLLGDDPMLRIETMRRVLDLLNAQIGTRLALRAGVVRQVHAAKQLAGIDAYHDPAREEALRAAAVRANRGAGGKAKPALVASVVDAEIKASWPW